jgi:iron complex outermembrane receptor protein
MYSSSRGLQSRARRSDRSGGDAALAVRRSAVAAGVGLALASGMALAQQSTTSSGPLEEIIVVASQVTLPPPYAGGQVARGGRAGILGNLDTMETPFASTSYTAELILDQQAESVADVLLNDPVVRAARGFGNFQELFIIRGFPAFSDDMTYNGIYGILPRQYVAAEFLERVELFRGASAFLNGAAPGGSNLGGTVNLVPKRAPEQPLSRLTAGYENESAFYGAVDFGRRFGSDDSTGIRANAVFRDGETSVADQDRELSVFSFGIDHQGERLRLAADLGYQDHRIDSPRPSVTPLGEIPEPPEADGNFAQPWTYTDEKQLFGVVRAEFDLSDRTSIWGAFGMRDGEEANVLSNPAAQQNGDTFAYRFDNYREDEVYSGEAGLRIEFDTGPIGHRMIVSASMFSLESKNAYAFSDFFFGQFPGNLYNPTDVEPPPANFFTGGSLSDPNVTQKTDTVSYAIADTMSFSDGRFLVTVGAREQNIESETFDYNTGASNSHYDESKVTPVGGIVFRPSESLSFYVNYIEGLIAGDVPPTVSNGLPVVNGGEAQDPLQAEQLEAGVKYDSGNYGVTLSVFNIERPFGVLEPFDDPDTVGDDLIYSDDGEQRNRGVEVSIFGQLHETVRVLGGLTWLDAEMTKTQGGLFEGNDAVGSPDTQANVNVEWDLPIEGLTLDARAIYTSSQYADAANDIEVSSWTRFDIGARYSFTVASKPVTLRARLNNVTDEKDWVSVGGFPGSNYLVLGDPMTLAISASVDF